MRMMKNQEWRRPPPGSVVKLSAEVLADFKKKEGTTAKILSYEKMNRDDDQARANIQWTDNGETSALDYTQHHWRDKMRSLNEIRE